MIEPKYTFTKNELNTLLKANVENTLIDIIETLETIDKDLQAQGRYKRCETACQVINKALMELEQCQI